MDQQDFRDLSHNYPDHIAGSLNRYTLAFEGKFAHLENLFLKSHSLYYFKQARSAGVIAFVLYLAFGLADALWAPEHRLALWFVRYVVFGPCLFAILLFCFSRWFKWQYMQPVISLVIVLTATSIIIMMIIIAPKLYSLGLIIVALVNYTSIGARFTWASFSGLLILACFIAALMYMQTDAITLAVNLLIAISLMLIGSFACYTTEADARHNFLLSYLLQKEHENIKALNTSLEEKVLERTAALKDAYEKLKSEMEERLHAEARLFESEKRFAAISETAQDWIFSKNSQMVYTFVNPSMCWDLGLRASEILGKTALDIYDRQTVEKLSEMDKAVLAGEVINTDLTIRLKGEERIVNIVKVPMSDEAGRFIGLSGIVRDITRRKAMEESIMRAEKLDTIGILAGGVAHDFNNLLMGMYGHVSLMLFGMDKQSKYYERLKNIENCILDATGLTRQLLGFARGGKYEIQTTDLNFVIKKTAGMFWRTKKEIRIILELGDIWPAEVDRGQIEQVLMNLFINAWQAMPQGGDLTISSQNTVVDESLAKSHGIAAGRFIEIAVSDTGIGMNRETLKRIFDPFFTTKQHPRGTGLGLSSAEGIVKNHGGFVTVSSRQGEGSAFFIHLPASKNVVAVEPAIVTGLGYGKETLLFVDDEVLALKAGQDMLEALGYTVLVAESGTKALEIFKGNSQSIDLVVLDMIMPDMSGGKLFDILKEMAPEVKVLLASGYSMESQVADIMQKGCNGFIQKPFGMEKLSREIRKVLDGQ
ncbi:MAG: response regulator [Desulfatibacillaceae bacterium]|nr:response regulator [Desulfatibacillaceae bacterium]